LLNRHLTALAVLCAALLVPAAPAVAQRDVPPGFVGVNYDADIAERAPQSLQDKEFGGQAEAGAESTRVVFSWNKMQTRRGGTPRWSRTDPLVEHAAAHGIDLLPVVIEAPKWARENPRSYQSPPLKDPRYLGRFMVDLIGRYGENGTFWTLHPEIPKRPLRTWQMWNEPHLRFQWDSDRPWAKDYGRQLRFAYKAIKRADPGATVVMAALSNTSWEFLEELYKKGRVHGYFDVAAMHPYTRRPDGVIALTRRFRTVMRRNGDAKKQLWITELGLPASKGREKSKNVLQTTDEGMADFLTTSMEKLIAYQGSANVRVSRVYWYSWASVYCCGDIFRYTGLRQYDPRDQTLKDKPAMASFVDSARRHEGCVKNTSGACQ
jgi:hypothetical protein